MGRTFIYATVTGVLLLFALVLWGCGGQGIGTQTGIVPPGSEVLSLDAGVPLPTGNEPEVDWRGSVPGVLVYGWNIVTLPLPVPKSFCEASCRYQSEVKLLKQAALARGRLPANWIMDGILWYNQRKWETLSAQNDANVFLPVTRYWVWCYKRGTVLSFSAPYLNSMNPAQCWIGGQVTLSGVNFGASQNGSQVSFNGVNAAVSSWSETQVVTIVPPAATDGPVRLIINSQASNALEFTLTPRIASLNPASGTAGTTVTLYGDHFGPVQDSGTVSFNGINSAVTFWSDTLIICSVPAEASTGPVVVCAGGKCSNSDKIFALPVGYDDFEDGVLNGALWATATTNGGTVTETGGYLRVWAGIWGFGGGVMDAAAVASNVDFKNFTSSEITFNLDWWKWYKGGGYIDNYIYITDGVNQVPIVRLNSSNANSESGGGSYKLVINGSQAQLFRNGSAMTGSISLAALNGYKLKFYGWINKNAGSWVVGSPNPFSAEIRVYDLNYIAVP